MLNPSNKRGAHHQHVSGNENAVILPEHVLQHLLGQKYAIILTGHVLDSDSVLQSVRLGPKVHGFKYAGASIRAFPPLFARIQVLSPFPGGNGSHFLGAPMAPGKWLSVAAPPRIRGAAVPC